MLIQTAARLIGQKQFFTETSHFLLLLNNRRPMPHHPLRYPVLSYRELHPHQESRKLSQILRISFERMNRHSGQNRRFSLRRKHAFPEHLRSGNQPGAILFTQILSLALFHCQCPCHPAYSRLAGTRGSDLGKTQMRGHAADIRYGGPLCGLAFRYGKHN